jgi:dTDP-glucose pyrophosphorylase
MKGITLAGGTGSHLYTQTKITNRHFLPVHDKPTIHYHLHTSKLISYKKMKISDRIFGRMNIDIMEGIEAAATKWNFNVYYPCAGVGGHCLPVDPYYLVTKAEELGLAEDFTDEENVVFILGDNIFQNSIRENVWSFIEGVG